MADGRLLLGEIGFTAAVDGTTFVEVFNAGGTAVGLDGMALANETGDKVSLPAGSLEPGAALAVPFDDSEFLGAAGEVVLAAPDGTVLDRVAWGDGMVDAVPLGRAGVLPDPEPGSTIGRVPTDASVSASAWTYFRPDEASPGARNPRPAVGLLLPPDGSIVAPGASLGWYPVAGAERYRVQVAADSGFTELLVDTTADEPTVRPDLSPGSYLWRVEAVAADGLGAGWSSPARITVEDGIVEEGIVGGSIAGTSPRGAIVARTAAYQPHTVAGQVASSRVAIPLLAQRKDTPMLEMQSVKESGGHAWNVAHEAFESSDKSDNMNCVLASAAMINRFFGGTLSQDRLGYEVLQGMAAGPETDLNYGRGFSYGEVGDILAHALGGRSTQWSVVGDDQGVSEAWERIAREIDAGRPLVAIWVSASGGHATVIVGYEARPEGRFLRINDPFGPSQYLLALAAAAQGNLPDMGASSLNTVYSIPAAPVAGDDEPEVATDSDGDGVTDFDEVNRFRTNPGAPDTDGDGIGDFDEIRATVFDPTHGHAATGAFSGRDIDGDGNPMELDTDSDDGGCDDGLEDADRNGEYAEGAETHNFDKADDACYRLEMQVNAGNGSSTMAYAYAGQFSVLPDGSLTGDGKGTITGIDPETPCFFDLRSRQVGATATGSFTFDIGGQYRVARKPAGRLPQPQDTKADYAIEVSVRSSSFTTVIDDPECKIGEENVLTGFLRTFAENPGWFIGEYRGPIPIPAGVDEIPDIPVKSRVLPRYKGTVAVDVEQVGNQGP